MKRILFYVLACIAALPVLAQNSQNDLYVPNELYVKLKSDQPLNRVEYIPRTDNPTPVKNVWSVVQAHEGISMLSSFKGVTNSTKNVYRIKVKDGANIDALIADLQHHPNVDLVQRIPVYYIQFKPAELDESKQWYFKTINMDNSWSNPRVSNEKVIAIIDNGVRYTHEDLFSRIAWNINPFNPDKSEIPNDGIDNDGNGYIDDYFGWDAGDGDSDPSPIPRPSNLPDGFSPKFGWHGTHVAGIVAASADNGVGIASLGINNRIVCIKAVSSKPDSEGRINDLALTNVAEALEYAIKRKVDVINCSFATKVYDPLVEALIADARAMGILVVAAAGNSQSELAIYPAAYEGVIGVGATDQEDHIASYSNFGKYIDVMAPGVDIYSTISTGDGEYGYMSGTSMAAPIVSSLIGLILSYEPSRIDQIESIIKGGCDNIDWRNPSHTGKMGAGRINVDKSFSYLETFTSVKEVGKYNSFTTYPNPATGSVFIPFETLSANGQAVSISIYNSVGALVATQHVSNGQEAISVAQLAQGVYQVTASNTNGQNYSSRLIINR